MLSYDDIAETLGALAEELETMAERHRQNMRESDDPLAAAEHAGISRGFLCVASKIRTSMLNK